MNLYLRNIFAVSNETSGCLFLSNYTVGILTCSSKRNAIYLLFDSHCTNSREITDNLLGFSVLLKFADSQANSHI